MEPVLVRLPRSPMVSTCLSRLTFAIRRTAARRKARLKVGCCRTAKRRKRVSIGRFCPLAGARLSRLVVTAGSAGVRWCLRFYSLEFAPLCCWSGPFPRQSARSSRMRLSMWRTSRQRGSRCVLYHRTPEHSKTLFGRPTSPKLRRPIRSFRPREPARPDVSSRAVRVSGRGQWPPRSER